MPTMTASVDTSFIPDATRPHGIDADHVFLSASDVAFTDRQNLDEEQLPARQVCDFRSGDHVTFDAGEHHLA